MNFEKVLAKKRQLVWKEIQKYLQSPLLLSGNLKIPSRYSSLVKFHWDLTAAYPERLGKYVRPTLLLLTAEAMGVPQSKAIKTAAAMQTSEDWILVHDDFEDNSLMRRGKPALHRIHGPELAVNAGDALHMIMWRMLRDNEKILGPKKTFEIMDEFYQMLARTALGQTVEIKWIQENRQNLTDKDCFFVFDGKTVYYTIAGPMRLGAILAGASKKQLEGIYEFAQPLGRCFQIKDDLLDLTSDFRGLKKQIGNDIYEGKRTIMLMHLFRTAGPKDKAKLTKIMNKTREEKVLKEVKFVLNLMGKYGSLEYGQKLAEKLANQASTIFEKKMMFLSKSPAREELKAAIQFIIQRDF